MFNIVLSCKVPACGKTARFYAILTWYGTQVFSNFLSLVFLAGHVVV